MEDSQAIELRRFSQERCLPSEYEFVSPEELYSEYVKFTLQPVERVVFTGEMIRFGWILYRPCKDDPMPETGWRMRLRRGHSDLPDPTSTIQDQLETLRNQTFQSILNARRAGRHSLANQATKAYLEILRARREEFPPDIGNKEGADYVDPE